MKQKAKAKSNKKNSQRRRNNRYLLLWLAGCVLLVGLSILLCKKLMPREVYYNYDSGFYDNDLEVGIQKSNDFLVDGIIKYNLNGDDLARTNEVYSEKIKLEVPEEGYKLYTITAAICEENNECYEPKVVTYVLGKNLKDDVTVDIVSINSSWENLYNYYTGILVAGRVYDENLENNPGEYVGGNYSMRGDEWGREAYVTIFDVNRQSVEEQDAVLEVSGGTSAAYDVKSMKITMGDKSFRLRTSGQDQFSGKIRSSLVSRLGEAVSLGGAPRTRRVVVFLNGEFYGISDRQINFSKQNLARMFNLEKAKKVEKYKGGETSVFNKFEVTEELWKNLDDAWARENLEERVDMDNYLRYFAFQILVNNTDWPMNGFEGWRYRGENKTGNRYEDGRIRFLIYDTDLIYYTEGNVEYFEGAIGDNFKYLMEDKYRATGSHFNEVMESEYYKERFIDILQEYLNGAFRTENVLQIIDEEAEKIRHQVELFSSEEEYEKWEEWIELMKKAVQEREDVVREDVWKYFGVEI